MTRLFLKLYDFFSARKPVFWLTFILVTGGLAYGAARIKIEEDFTKFFPNDKKVEELSYVFQNSKLTEQLVVMVSVKDSATAPLPDSLAAVAGELVTEIEHGLGPYVRQIVSRVDDEKILDVFNSIRRHLPVFLSDRDYVQLDSLIQPGTARATLKKNYNQLISPAGLVVKRILAEDPLGFSYLALKKLRSIQYDQNFELYDNYILTRDHRHLIFFLKPAFAASETAKNSVFIDELSNITRAASEHHTGIVASYFGATAVAVGNAVQLRRDSAVTMSLLIMILIVFLVGFFKKKRAPFLILIPLAFGGVFALCAVYLFQTSVSILAVAAGSVILGIAVNYALHFLAHLKHTHDIRAVIQDLTGPMTLGSATTVLAFFCLQFTNAPVLRDVGLFAGFSLIGAALCSLVFLPHFIPEKFFPPGAASESWIDRIPFATWASKRWIVVVVFVMTPVFYYFARKVDFNSDMTNLNYMSPELRTSQQRLEAINRASLGSVFVAAHGKTLEEALRKNEEVMPTLSRLKERGEINKYASVSAFLISDSLQEVRLRRWNTFWTPGKKEQIIRVVHEEGRLLKFSPRVMANFDSLISTPYQPDANAMNAVRVAFFDDYIIEKNGRTTVLSLIDVDPARKKILYHDLEGLPVRAFDRLMLTNLFVKYVNADFNFIVTFTALLVFASLLISYGRIELTLITFVPMFITWIWILGIMALAGIQFNIVNVMVSTFIFGLGDDYSIFIMDGLQQDYISGKKNLSSIRTSIFLSTVTTIAGLGVLIFARHPAMRSVASISIIGIVCVFVMSQTIEPYLFRALITNRTRRGFVPATFTGMLRTTYTYASFVAGAVILTIVGTILRWIPVAKRPIRSAFHWLLSAFAWSVIYMDPIVKKKIIGRTPQTFAKAQVVIANHSSFLDILLTTLLHPKLILLTNTWVWNSPIFGGVVRLADYYPVSDGAEESVGRVRERVSDGYSVVVFPEGSRSEHGEVRRFHKGAFYMADALGVPVLPLLIHGASDTIPKGSFHINPGQLTLKFLPAIAPEDARFGRGYSERAKKISAYFRAEYATLKNEIETPSYFRHKLIANYLYKGPVLEWYLRIKLRLEKNYASFDALLPTEGTILDLGCGYGFLGYMLQFRSPARIIIGVDYDEEKIETARHGYSKTDRLEFFHADVREFGLGRYNGIVISDVLHYLAADDQQRLIEKCLDALYPGGVLIIRDGNADLGDRHRGTALTEFFSIRFFRFNKSTTPLHFLSGKTIQRIAENRGMHIEIIDDAKFTSNVNFVIRKGR
jgi:1-acyl-sn-glycerol-3-phosphate acyltransferase